MRRAVFLDRDGVLNRPVFRHGISCPPANLRELEIVPGAAEACELLRAAGFLLIVATNQPDVARGTMTRETVEEINEALRAQIVLDDFRVCFHDDDPQCACRKPAPGLLTQAALDWGIDLKTSVMVGDRAKDIEAGRRAGCKTVLIGDDERAANLASADFHAGTLLQAVNWITKHISSATAAKEEHSMKSIADLKVKLFADGADRAGMLEMYAHPNIRGFTTNPTLMRKAGVDNYRDFARDILQVIHNRPISFEVFADDFESMEAQALEIASWGKHVYVKIPVTNTHSESSAHLLRRLARANVKLNVTALTTLSQVREVCACLADGPSSYVSVFAGRIADTGRDPVPLMAAAVEMLSPYPDIELIWASPRELLNVFQADAVGCHVITATNDILKKLSLVGKDLQEYSLDTVKMFYQDAQKAGYTLDQVAVH